MKYHITDNGPKICHATKRKCRYGELHFNNEKDASVYFEKQFNNKILVTKTKNNKKMHQYLHHPFFNSKEYDGLTGRELLNIESKEPAYTDDDLGIVAYKRNGALVNDGYFSMFHITGKINYNNLDKDSYMKFGFGKVDEKYFHEDNVEEFSRCQGVDEDAMVVLSKMELMNHTNDETKRLKFFSSNDYDWVNRCFYSGYDHLNTPNKYANPAIYHRKFVDETAEILDKALDKGVKVQRIVYRGMAQTNETFSELGISPKEWLDQNISLGKELKMDGYASSTSDFDMGHNYTGYKGNGILFEILTPEGLNISSVSKYEHEKEVLLPRGARYMVVGLHKDIKEGEYKGKNQKVLHIVQLVAINEDGEILDGTNSSVMSDA